MKPGGGRMLGLASLVVLMLTTSGCDLLTRGSRGYENGTNIEHYLMLAYDPELGIGVEQLIGFIEVPAESDVSSAGWPLGGAAMGTTISLGDMDASGNGDQAIVTSTDPDELIGLLGADRADVLFQAERDNALKLQANLYLNRDSLLALRNTEAQVLEGTLENAKNSVSSIDDALGTYTYSFGFERARNGLEWADFADGSNVFVVTPPAVVTSTSGESAPIDFGPDSPIRSDTYWPNGGDPDPAGINALSFLGPPPEGLWTVELNGELDSVVDMSFANLFDPSGNFYYFVPRVQVNVADDERVTGFEIEFSYWDGSTGAYVDVPETTTVETEYIYIQITEPDDSLTDVDLEFESGIAGAPSDVYWNADPGQRRLDGLRVGFVVGTRIDFAFGR